MPTLLTRFTLQAIIPIQETPDTTHTLSIWEAKNHVNITFDSSRTKVRAIFRREGYLLETEPYLAKIQQDLEKILEQNLLPAVAHTEDIEAPQEVRIPRLYGRKEIQELLGLTRQRVSRIQNDPKYEFPAPVYSHGYTVLWKAKEVDFWITDYRKNRRLNTEK